MFKQLTKREQLILQGTAGIVFFGLVFHILLNPLAQKYSVLDKKIAVTKAKLEKNQQLIAQKDFFQNVLSKLGQGTLESEPLKDPIVGMLSELEKLAKDSGVSLTDIRPKAAREGVSSRELVVDMRTEGGVKDYLKFMFNIENSTSLFSIKKIQLNSKSNGDVLEGSFSIARE
ncbi:MAG: type 4a pilus biogenesis protein PilO [Candidatus Omnitrophica bacterium]|nr:type 4a pilus biogenesis protein PilO [Candidatus Omnitrophota bacterium]